MRAGSGLTNNSALGKSSPPTGSGMAEALRPVPVRFICEMLLRVRGGWASRAARACAAFSEIGLAVCKALEWRALHSG